MYALKVWLCYIVESELFSETSGNRLPVVDDPNGFEIPDIDEEPMFAACTAEYNGGVSVVSHNERLMTVTRRLCSDILMENMRHSPTFYCCYNI